MVEFGAGGKVNRREGDGELSGGPSETTPTTAGEPSTANGETAEGGAHATPVAAVTPATTQPTRRKKKAKGWFCPVCRQREFLPLVPGRFRFSVLGSQPVDRCIWY